MDIEKIAALARLKLTAEEKAKFSKQINDILNYVNKLDEIPEKELTNVHLEGVQRVENLREDEVGKSLDIKNVFQNAPDKEKNYFRIKGVMERNRF